MRRTLLLLSLLSMPLSAAAEKPRTTVALKGGVSVFFNTQSFALGHLMKPAVRLEGTYALDDKTRVGVELVGQLAGEDYRLIGGYFTYARALYSGAVYAMELAGGAGIGTAPKILYKDLKTDNAVTIWSQVALRHRWALGSRFNLGIDVAFENLSTVALSGTFGASL